MNEEKLVYVRMVKLDDAPPKNDDAPPKNDDAKVVQVKYIENNRKSTQVRAYSESELLRIVAKLEKSINEEENTGEESGKSENEPDLQGILFVDLNRKSKQYWIVRQNEKKYEDIRKNNGVLELVNMRFEEDKDQDSDQKQDENKKSKLVPTGKIERFKRLMCGSSHSRQGKAVFIREDLYEAVHTILLGGMGKPNGTIEFKKGCAKWNAYYALAATDSTPVTTPDKIIVIEDFIREITTKCDVVTMEKENNQVKYSLYSNMDYTIPANVFDGAGLVSVAMAEQWKEDMGLDYIPASFQIRAIPGIKGNVYTFDIAKFAKEKNDGKYEINAIKNIEYINGEKHVKHKTVTFDENDKVVILTESQVKFLSMYGYDIDAWREEFNKPVEVEVNGKNVKYSRTFNISEYSEKQDEVKKHRYTAYQHLQTVEITGDDAESLVNATMSRISEISKDILKFLKYRQAIDETSGEETGGDDEKSKEILPPYYKAAAEYVRQLEKRGKDEEEIKKRLEKCFADSYFVKKMKDDIQARKDGAYTGKLTVRGNYQVFTPDLFALCQHAFGKEPTGLLKDDEIYSAWWLKSEEKDKKRFKCNELAITRNPQIYMESRIVKPARRGELDEWFSYQETGILISSHSHVPYALGTADFDGDTVATTNNTVFLNAVKAEIEAGNGNTVYLEKDAEMISGKPVCEVFAECGEGSKAPSSANMNDIKSLMEADLIAFKNNIGTVVNLITRIWNFDQNSEGYRYYFSESKSEDDKKSYYMIQKSVSEEETKAFLAQRRNYLKIMSVIGQLTLDAAKTGDEVVIPKGIKNFIKNNSDKHFEDVMPKFMSHKKKKKRPQKVKSETIFPTALTMDGIYRKVNISLNEARSEMRRYILLEYQTTGYFLPFSLDEEGEKCRKSYEELRDCGDENKEEEALKKLVDAALESITWQSDFKEFKKIAHVGEVDGKLYDAAKETMGIAYNTYTAHIKYIEEIEDSKEKQRQYKTLYRMLKPALLTLNGEAQKLFDEGEKITAGALLDCYITAVYEDITAPTAPKDVLWNCFGDEITERIKNGRTEEEDRPKTREELKLKGRKLEEVVRDPRSSGKTPFDGKKADITFYESDLEFIKQTVEETFKNNKPTREKMFSFCTAFAVITKARAGKRKRGFTIDEITKNKTGFVRDYMCVNVDGRTARRYFNKIETYLKELINHGFLEKNKDGYRVKLPEPAGETIFSVTTLDEAFKKAAEAILSEIT